MFLTSIYHLSGVLLDKISQNINTLVLKLSISLKNIKLKHQSKSICSACTIREMWAIFHQNFCCIMFLLRQFF